MHKDFVPPVSIEEFAAYLDGNLSDDKMQSVSSVIENNETMLDIVGQNGLVEDLQETYNGDDNILPIELESLNFNTP